jgi:hypothetical protein
MRWREPAGTVVGTVGPLAWVGLGVLIAKGAYAVLEHHATTAHVLVLVIATVFAVGGLVISWMTAEQIEFWRLGYRVRQLSPKGLLHWSQGPKQCVYEERAASGQIQGLPFVRTIFGDGYPAPSEVCLPKEEDWDSQMPSWAHGRRKEIMERMNQCSEPNAAGRVSYTPADGPTCLREVRRKIRRPLAFSHHRIPLVSRTPVSAPAAKHSGSRIQGHPRSAIVSSACATQFDKSDPV